MPLKKICAIATLLLLTIIGCKKEDTRQLILDNQSDYEVTIKLETGETTNSGTVLWKEHVVASKTKATVPLQDNTVNVSGYSPKDKIKLTLNEKKSTITFENK